jgi:hypothetical protein
VEEITVNEQPMTNQPDDLNPLYLPAEETLVADPRGEMTPSQFVERKLVTLLRATPLPVSLVHTGRFTGR